MTIREATRQDLQAILDIYNDAILNTTAVYDYKAHTLDMRVAWFEDKITKNIPVLVAVVDGAVAGFASYGPFRAWAAYKYSVEHSVYVHKDFRKQGIASRLMRELIAVLNTKEVHTMIAGIDAANAVSIQLHERLGFTEIGVVREVGYKFGRWLDLKFFQLIIQNNLSPNSDA